MQLTRYACLSVMMSLAASVATAQDLSKEITVEHDIVPEKRDAVKPLALPVVALRPLSSPDMSLYYDGVPVRLSPTASSLPPAAYADSIFTPSTRGYAALGYFPTWNLAASAGYRFIDNDHTRLNAWVQYDGDAYKGYSAIDESYRQWIRRNTATAGAGLHQAVGRHSFVEAALSYTYDRLNSPTELMIPATDCENGDGSGKIESRSVNRLNADVIFTSHASWLKWHAGAGYSLFANSSSPLSRVNGLGKPGFPGVDENHVRLLGGISGADGPSSWGAEISADFFGLSDYATMIWSEREAYNHGSGSRTLLSLRPYYRYATNTVTIRAGLRIDAEFGPTDGIHIAPEVKLQWSPIQQFAVYAEANGGLRPNSLGSLMEINPYALPSFAYGNSRVVIDAKGGLRVGPFRGASLEAYVGYASAHDWLMPVEINALTLFRAGSFKGGIVGGAISYDDSRLAAVRISYERALPASGLSGGYYLWRDRARQSVKASISLRPIDRLEIRADYEFRDRRHILADPVTDQTLHIPVFHRYDLGIVSDLGLGARYSINHMWSVFLSVDNILCRRHRLIGDIESQGLNGLAGFTYKF